MVFVFTQPHCQPCRLTKKMLDELDIAYVESDMDDDVRAEAVAAGCMSAPIVTVNGEMWSGFRPDRIKALAT